MSELAVPKISVIIPCYHAAKYLPTIVGCFAAQTFQDFEIILVNDGDAQQLPVMQQLQEKNDKIHIMNKENGGLSSARNAGMDAAEGKWIVFTDPDDEVKPHYLQSLYNAVTKDGADVAIGGSCRYFTKQNKFLYAFIEANEYDKSFCLSKIYEFIWFGDRYNAAWNKIFNTQFLRQNHCYFPKGLYEDSRFFSSLLLITEPKIALCRDCGYVYVIHDKSLTHNYIANCAQYLAMDTFLKRQVMEKIGWNKDRIEGTLSYSTYYTGLMICSNFFQKGTPLSFVQQIKSIRTDVLQNEEIMRAFKIFKVRRGNVSMRIYNMCIETHSAFLTAFMFRLLYWCKYHLYSFYLKIKHMFKKN